MQKPDSEWRQVLTPEQFAVLREKATEPPFSGEYDGLYADGVYACAACGQVLFESGTKFDAHCGWPSFYDVIESGKIKEEVDDSYGMKRTEVVCSNCEAHLGHVFDDGPKDTGERYCINSCSIAFEPKK